MCAESIDLDSSLRNIASCVASCAQLQHLIIGPSALSKCDPHYQLYYIDKAVQQLVGHLGKVSTLQQLRCLEITKAPLLCPELALFLGRHSRRLRRIKLNDAIGGNDLEGWFHFFLAVGDMTHLTRLGIYLKDYKSLSKQIGSGLEWEVPALRILWCHTNYARMCIFLGIMQHLRRLLE